MCGRFVQAERPETYAEYFSVADIKVDKTDAYGYHVVKPGDSLSKIAKSAYDNAGDYMRIFEANKDILKNPDLIHPGQRLKLPNKG